MHSTARWIGFLSVGVFGLAAITAVASRSQPVKQAPVSPTSTEESVDLLRTAPRALPPALSGIGRRLVDVPLTDLSNKTRRLASFSGPRGLVVALVSSSCPVALKTAPALGRLEAEAKAQGFGVVYLACIASDTPAELAATAKTAAWKAPVLRDTKNAALAALGATSTTEAFVFDSARTLVYRGAVSDQYGPTWAKDAPTVSYLSDALHAVSAGALPTVPATTAPGCQLTVSSRPQPLAPSVTYHNRVSRIIQANCGDCHRTGGVAPFPLDTYEQVVAHAAMIRTVVNAGQMPPWFAAPTKGDDGKTATHTLTRTIAGWRRTINATCWHSSPGLNPKGIQKTLPSHERSTQSGVSESRMPCLSFHSHTT